MFEFAPVKEIQRNANIFSVDLRIKKKKNCHQFTFKVIQAVSSEKPVKKLTYCTKPPKDDLDGLFTRVK